MSDRRLARLRPRLAELGLEAFIVSAAPDVQYLSGFRGSAGTLVIAADRQLLVSDFRYRSQVAEQAPEWEFVEVPQGRSQLQVVAETAAAWGRVGGQTDKLTHADWLTLAASGFELVPVSGLVAELRQIKDATELAAIERAAELADATMRRAWEMVRPGLTERQLKAELEYFLLQQGAEGPSFDMILAGGPHSALPHAPITDRPLVVGDLLTLDLGARVDGYCSDLTRTIAIGSSSPAQRALYDLVYRAQTAGLAALRPGATGREVDEAARAIIREAGHGDHFGHGLGHAVGLEIHESPRLSVVNDQPLVAGQVLTVEPGVYVPGLGGVRIEDLVVLTETGYRLLSRVEKPVELMAIG